MLKDYLDRFERFLDGTISLRARALLVLLSLPLLLAFWFPLWNISMVAPQYPNGLELDIYSWKVEGGDGGNHIQEINTLNHYIGMAPIDEVVLNDLDWIPFLFGLLVILVLRVAAIGNLRMLVDLAVLSTYLCGFLMFRFWFHLWTLGHNLDPKAPMTVDPFMPALFGTKQIANFTITSMPRLGTAATAISVGGVMLATFFLLCRGWLRYRRERRAAGA
jgi:hypothetical protein